MSLVLGHPSRHRLVETAAGYLPELAGHTANTSNAAPSSPAPDLAQYRLEAITFVGYQVIAAERLKDAYHVTVGNKFDHSAWVRASTDRGRLTAIIAT
jgi:hypothetical protein